MRARQAHCGPYESRIHISASKTRLREIREYVPATIYKKIYNHILTEMMSILECDVNSPFNVC